MSQLSTVWLSCDFTSRASGQRRVPDQPYTIPDEATRLLRARLIWEEAHETIRALGVSVLCEEGPGYWISEGNCELRANADYVPASSPVNLEGIIDGCCDLIYVAVGTLWACGVPDVPHMEEVIRANDAKFPNGQGIPHPKIAGKFGKPEGWTPPDHRRWFPEGSK